MFPKDIHGKLGWYIYKLIDPRNGKVFYVGKGKDNRVFEHLKEAESQNIKKISTNDEEEDDISLKIATINKIRSLGLEPIHIIHRHGMETEDEAYLAEAVLIDEIAGLSNIMGGHYSQDNGPAHVKELIEKYKSETMNLKHRVLAITVNNTTDEGFNIYQAVRCAWRINVKRAEKAEFVFAVMHGICRDVFVPEIPWLPATIENFPRLDQDLPRKYGFNGRRADKEIIDMYVGKRLPEDLQRKKGMSYPILYNYE